MEQKMLMFVKALEVKHFVTVIMDIWSWEENAYKVTIIFFPITLIPSFENHKTYL